MSTGHCPASMFAFMYALKNEIKCENLTVFFIQFFNHSSDSLDLSTHRQSSVKDNFQYLGNPHHLIQCNCKLEFIWFSYFFFRRRLHSRAAQKRVRIKWLMINFMLFLSNLPLITTTIKGKLDDWNSKLYVHLINFLLFESMKFASGYIVVLHCSTYTVWSDHRASWFRT